MSRIASCCCGACQLAADGEPVLNAICHCDSCKRRTGSAFGWSAYFPDAALGEPTGPLAVYEPKAAPSPTRRYFCQGCGTTLFWRSEGFMPGHTGIAGGCFAATPLGEPNISATHAGRCAWVSLPEGWVAAP